MSRIKILQISIEMISMIKISILPHLNDLCEEFRWQGPKIIIESPPFHFRCQYIIVMFFCKFLIKFLKKIPKR